jgi:NADPH-dependent 7-cyano-7-deazaguanine reductase QueF
MRRPGFEPGLPDWQSDVLDQTGRPSHLTRFMGDYLTTFRCIEIEKCTDEILYDFYM